MSQSRFTSRWSGLDWLLIVLGLAGTSLVALSAPALAGTGQIWWLKPAFNDNTSANYLLVYFGMALTIAAWIGIGRRLASHGSTRSTSLVLTLVIWSVPLLVVPPLFSGDVYSYLAQGTLLHLGLNPYHVTPAALGNLHHVALANAVSPFWRHTTSPYGPLFLGAMSLIAAMTSNLELGVILARLVELVGVLAMATAVPRIAKSCGADPSRALWLCVLSPLTLFGLLAPGHNDALMIGFMTLGVATALAHRPLVGIALCAIGSTIKAPAGIAAIVILICWLRAESTRTDRWMRVIGALAVSAAMLIAASLITGLGFAWLSPSVLATPGRVHLAITPVSEIAWLVHAIDAGASIPTAQSVIGKLALACAGIIAVWLLMRVHEAALVRTAGIILVTVAALGPAAWPWYFTWGIALVACDPQLQRSRALVPGIVAGCVVIKPDGILALPYSASAFVLIAYLAVGIAATLAFRRRAHETSSTSAGKSPGTIGP